jgi:diguanylate cyclase (GGDEF)-like protein
LDTSTTVLALALGNLILCAALFFFDVEQRKHPVLATWARSRQLQAAAWLVLMLSGSRVLPEGLAIVAGYGLLFGGVALEAGAMWQAQQRPGWRRPIGIGFGLLFLGFLACYASGLSGLRVVAAALILGVGYGASAAALGSRWGQASLLQRALALGIGLLALLVAARALLVLLTPSGWTWLANTFLQSLASAALYGLMLATAFGMLLLSREQVQLELERLQVVDALTDVPNRRGFFALLSPWLALARRPGLPTALVVLDLDNFKRLNDSYGHGAGDVVMRSLIEVCKKQLRDSDQLGRLVGGEFAVLLPRTGLNDALMVAERIRAAIEGHRVKTERALIGLTASLGVTTLRPDDSLVSLFKRADEALQQSKREGRNRVSAAAEPQLPEG